MGDRALVIFKADRDVSPTVYLHWHGSDVPELVGILKERMAGRIGDACYACARFTGICHNNIDGNLGLGLMNTPEHVQAAVLGEDRDVLLNYSHGDAGVVVVDATDFSWKAFGGYLAEGN